MLSMQAMMQCLCGARHFVTHGLGGSWLPSVAVLRWVTVPGESVTRAPLSKGINAGLKRTGSVLRRVASGKVRLPPTWPLLQGAVSLSTSWSCCDTTQGGEQMGLPSVGLLPSQTVS